MREFAFSSSQGVDHSSISQLDEHMKGFPFSLSTPTSKSSISSLVYCHEIETMLLKDEKVR